MLRSFIGPGSFGSRMPAKIQEQRSRRNWLCDWSRGNGAGQTTSISLMLGLRRPTGGQAGLFGRAPADRRARSRCGVMLQESGTTGVLTVREIVDLFRAYYPSPLAPAAAITMAGLDARADARAGTLSG